MIIAIHLTFYDKFCYLPCLNVKMSNMIFLELKWPAVGLGYGLVELEEITNTT